VKSVPRLFVVAALVAAFIVKITPAMRDLNWRLIREEVAKIARQYNFAQEP
jgi:hypothetical protein